ncbi:hypothetical protein [uncultured Cyclobacterium sp.]|uniref:hypothetical protein n=1 Tax=uncultured Cyclobacterium sp. TaxID=453820 RepID=UPI0030EBE896|tara:strand:+ start:151935 stop:153431 length:1497 start_codon:yes stop_codon:yes gene_type:complete
MCEIDPNAEKNQSKSTIYPILFLFSAILLGGILDFWKYGPYITQDTIGYFNMIQGKGADLTTLSPFYGFILSIFPFTLISIFDRIIASSVLVFFLAFYLIIKISNKSEQNSTSYMLVFGISLFSWWSFRILGSAHADSHFYIMFLLWVYLFVWKKEKSKRHFLFLCGLSALMVWVKLNTLFLIPLLTLWVFISKEKWWIYVIGSIIISWLTYKWIFPENILDLHLSHQVILLPDQVSPMVLLYENISSWFQVNIGIILSDLVTERLPLPFAFSLGCLSIVLQSFYLTKYRENYDKPIFKLLLISLVYSLFFISFQQFIGYKEINFRTLFPHLLVLSMAFWMYLIQNHRRNAILIIASLITFHTLVGHYMIWQRNDVSSLFLAKEFDRSSEKKSIEEILGTQHQQITTDSPERIMLSFSTMDVFQIAPENQFIEGKNYPLNEKEKKAEYQKNITSLLKGSAVIVLFHTDSLKIELNNTPQISSITENSMVIFYLDQSAK